jgi:hypothetical protein
MHHEITDGPRDRNVIEGRGSIMVHSGWNNGELAVGQMRWLQHAGLGVLALLLFIFPIPHTISLRYLLLLVAAGVFGYLAIKRGNPAILPRLWLPLALFGALLVWLFLGAVFISNDPVRTLSEVSSQWLMVLLSLMAGLVAGVALENDPATRRSLLHVVFFVLLAHVVIVDAQALWSTISSNAFTARAQGLTAGPDQSSYLTNMLLAFLLSQSLVRVAGRSPGLGLNNAWLFTAGIIALASLYAEGTRNSLPVLVVMCVAIVLLYLRHSRSSIRWLSAAGATALMIMLLVSLAYTTSEVKRGQDWHHVRDTVAIALDTEQHKGWLDKEKYGLPELPDGQMVEESTYLRVAWMKEGVLLVRDHPLGIGFDRNAFGQGLKMKYDHGRGHSHSGVAVVRVSGQPRLARIAAF